MIEIIPFEGKYLDSLCRLEDMCFDIPWTREMFEEEFKSSITHYLTAVDGGEVIGYAGLWQVIDEGQITNVAVHPEYRSRGIAYQLIKELIYLTYPKGITWYTLEVRESNSAAVRLYEKLGFKAVGKRKNYYADNGETAILMTLEMGNNNGNYFSY